MNKPHLQFRNGIWLYYRHGKGLCPSWYANTIPHAIFLKRYYERLDNRTLVSALGNFPFS